MCSIRWVRFRSKMMNVLGVCRELCHMLIPLTKDVGILNVSCKAVNWKTGDSWSSRLVEIFSCRIQRDSVMTYSRGLSLLLTRFFFTATFYYVFMSSVVVTHSHC